MWQSRERNEITSKAERSFHRRRIIARIPVKFNLPFRHTRLSLSLLSFFRAVKDAAALDTKNALSRTANRPLINSRNILYSHSGRFYRFFLISQRPPELSLASLHIFAFSSNYNIKS